MKTYLLWVLLGLNSFQPTIPEVDFTWCAPFFYCGDHWAVVLNEKRHFKHFLETHGSPNYDCNPDFWSTRMANKLGSRFAYNQMTDLGCDARIQTEI